MWRPIPFFFPQGDGDAALHKDMADLHKIVASNVTVRYIGFHHCYAVSDMYNISLVMYAHTILHISYLHSLPPLRHIANCSHWVQQDAPEEVNQFMREFLREWNFAVWRNS